MSAETTDTTSPAGISSDWTRDLRSYLQHRGWHERPPGPAGALWQTAQGDDVRTLAVPTKVEPGTAEWRGVLDRLAAYEQRPPVDVSLGIASQYADVTKLRAANDLTIADSIPLEVGVGLVNAAHAMLRAAATASFSPKGHIAGNYSRQGEEISAQARMAHTERGSYVVPIWMPLTPPAPAAEHTPVIDELEFHRAHEPPERRVTRTLAQALAAVQVVIVNPEHEPTPAKVHPLAVAGVSRELVSALHKLLATPSVATVEAEFKWAAAVPPPRGTESTVTLSASAAPRLERAANVLRAARQLPSQTITGPIVELRHRPNEPYGEVTIDTVRRGRPCEVRIRLPYEQLRRAYEWASEERTILVEGSIKSTPGRQPQIDAAQQFLPLDETFLSMTDEGG